MLTEVQQPTLEEYFYLKLEDFKPIFGKELEEFTYEEILKFFPNGAALPGVNKVISKKKAEWQRQNPEKRPSFTAVSEGGVVKSVRADKNK